MMVSDEEKRWLVVGIAMHKVAAPVLRDFIKQGMDTHYANNTCCHGVTPPCLLNTLTYHHVNADPNLRRLKFQNINNNLNNHGNHKNLYDYNINSSVDLAKLFLPDYLAEFSGFDESLDMSAILRLLGCDNPASIFLSPNPLISVQLSADDVRENVRNKWGHCNLADWTEVFFNYCFSKLKTLVRSLGLTDAVEKTTLDQLSNWQTKGCQLCMGNAVDQNLLSLVQQDIKELIKKYKKSEAEQSAIQESVAQLKTEQTEMGNIVTSIQDQQSVTRAQLDKHVEQLEAVLEWREQQMKENDKIVETLVSVEKTLKEELLLRTERVEERLAETDHKVEQLQRGFAKTDDKVGQLEQEFAKTDDKVEQLEQGFAETDDKVQQLEQEVRGQKMKENQPDPSPVGIFDVKTCQKKLAEHYQKTAKVPTTAWSSVLQVDLEQIYTRLSWVKEEQTTAGSSQKELSHYTEIFTEKTKKGVAAKRILVQGETGIGKTTFVKKLLVDWSNLEQAKMDKERKDALKKFDLVLCINLKEVSKCQTFKEMLSRSRLFAEDDEKSVDDLLCYIRKNQEKVLLVFDGYEEYRTGSEAEERYGSRSNSPFFEIFHGIILRDCTVLVTTRSSRADEIRGPADIQTEITGFNMSDRKDFMRKMLGSQTEVDRLLTFLRKSGMGQLARVPLLTLFFCLLWKDEKENLMDLTERKAKLYQAIVKHILQHSHRRHSSSKASKLKDTDYEEILTEIGRVALVGLLKGDLVFEFDQLPEKVRGEEGVIVGLFQFSEYGPSLAPKEMVSFIHKSIQEYLAAWYLIYSCVPEGNLGEIGQHVVHLEDCEALENVFQFVCGLSDEGAIKVLQHLTSVRISDSTLDFSKTIPDVETETVMPLCDVTRRHERFSNLVYDSFRQVQSTAELLSHFLDCTDGVILVSRERPLSDLMPNVKVLTKLAQNCVFSFSWFDAYESTCVFEESMYTAYDFDEAADYSDCRGFLRSHNFCSHGSVLCKSLEFLNSLQMPLRITESSEVLTFEDFIRKFRSQTSPFKRGCCSFSSILCFHKGQFQFYITNLFLQCDYHVRLFTEATTISVPSDAASLCSERSCLKFLSCLHCHGLRDQTCTMKALAALIGNCKRLSRIALLRCDDSMCYLLQQVQNPSKCSVTIGTCYDYVGAYLTSPGAVQLASLLSRFEHVTSLVLDLRDCCAAALDTLVASITHKTLEKLILKQTILTPTATKALGRSLPEMSSLQVLELTGVDGSILQAEDMEALFVGLNKPVPLLRLRFDNFSLRGCLATFCKCFHFFPFLKELELDRLNMNERDQCSLLESLRFIRSPRAVSVQIEQCWTEELSLDLTFSKNVSIRLNSLSPAVVKALGRSLPEMSSLQVLELTGVDGSILQAEDVMALFGGLNKPVPLLRLRFDNFSLRGCLATFCKCFHFFPFLKELELDRLNMNERDQCSLLESLRFIRSPRALSVQIEQCWTEELSLDLTFSVEVSIRLNSLSPSVAKALGRSLPEMSSLEAVEIIGQRDGSIFEAGDVGALFVGVNKTVPLRDLIFADFNARGYVAPLFSSFRFFPNLLQLDLIRLGLDERDLRGLLKSFQFIPNLQTLNLEGNHLGHAVRSIVPHLTKLPKLQYLFIIKTSHSEEDLNYVQDTVRQALTGVLVIR